MFAEEVKKLFLWGYTILVLLLVQSFQIAINRTPEHSF